MFPISPLANPPPRWLSLCTAGGLKRRKGVETWSTCVDGAENSIYTYRGILDGGKSWRGDVVCMWSGRQGDAFPGVNHCWCPRAPSDGWLSHLRACRFCPSEERERMDYMPCFEECGCSLWEKLLLREALLSVSCSRVNGKSERLLERASCCTSSWSQLLCRAQSRAEERAFVDAAGCRVVV